MTKIVMINERTIQLEDIEFMFRPNLEGRQEKYNRAGARYFNIVVEPEDVDILRDYGVNIKTYTPKPREDGSELPEGINEVYFFKVNVYYQYTKPTVVIVHDNCQTDIDEEIHSLDKTYLDEDSVSMVDSMEIELCDVILNRRDPSPDGIYARINLKTMYIRVKPDPLQAKWGI